MDVHNEVNQVQLHSKEIVVEEASFKSANGEIATLVEIGYNLKMTVLTLVFDKNVSLGKGSLSIKAKGILNGDMAGFYK